MGRKIVSEKAQKVSTKIKSLLTKNKPNLTEIIEIEKRKGFPYLYITHSPITLEKFINAKSLFPIFDLIAFSHAIGEDPVDLLEVYFEELRDNPPVDVWEQIIKFERDPNYKQLHIFIKAFKFVLNYPRLFLRDTIVRQAYMSRKEIQEATDRVMEIVATYKIKPEELQEVVQRVINQIKK